MTILIILGIIYLAFHLGSGHTHARYRKARGLSPHFFWSSVTGPYASVKIGGFRVGHRL